MSINIMTESYPVDLSVTEQPIKLTISNLMYQAHGSDTGGAVSSVNGQTGAVNLSASDVGAATASQGAKADSALQPSDVSTAGKTGSYNDLTDKPTIPVLPTLSTVATSGSYTDLTNKPDLTLKQNSLPTNGTAGQFLAHDLTFKTPASEGGNIPYMAVSAKSNYTPAKAEGTNSLAIGYNSQAISNSICIGNDLPIPAAQSNCVLIGINVAVSPASWTIGIGSGVRANHADVTVIGGQAVTNGTRAVVIGRSANGQQESVSVGYNNIASTLSTSVGAFAKAEGNKSTAIGAVSTVKFENSTALGAYSTVTATNQVQLGDSATTVYAYGAVQDRSDMRDKTDVQNCDLGLDFINALTPRKYKWDYREDYAKELFPPLKRDDFTDDVTYQLAVDQQQAEREAFFASPVKDGSKTRIRYHYGLIAQELKQVMDSQNTDFGGYQDHSENGGMCVKSIGYAELIPVLIKAVQELSAEVERLKK